MEIYERACSGVPKAERMQVFELYLQRASEFFGIGKVPPSPSGTSLAPPLRPPSRPYLWPLPCPSLQPHPSPCCPAGRICGPLPVLEEQNWTAHLLTRCIVVKGQHPCSSNLLQGLDF